MILGWQFLDIAINLVVIAHVVVSIFLILIILMQRPKQEGLGAAFGSGMTDAAFGAGATDALQKGTVYLGTLFFIFSLVLAILFSKRNAIEGKRADSDGASSDPVEAVVEPDAPEDPISPVSPAEEFKKKEQELLNTGGTPGEGSPVEGTPTEDKPKEDKPAEGTPTEDKPVEETSGEDAPTEDKPAEETSGEDAPTEDKPSEETSGEDAPTEDKPAEDTPAPNGE